MPPLPGARPPSAGNPTAQKCNFMATSKRQVDGDFKKLASGNWEASGASPHQNLKLETRNQNSGWSLSITREAGGNQETGTLEESGASPNWPQKPETGIQAGTGQAHKSLARHLDVSGTSPNRNLKLGTRNRNLGWSWAGAREPRWKMETVNLEASGVSPSQNLKLEKGIRAGAGQSHESSAESWKPYIEKRAEQV